MVADLDTLQEAVESFDPVARASVQILGGGVLSVTIEERVPVVVHRDADGLILLDDDGHRVNQIRARTDRPDLPLILGTGAEARVTEAPGWGIEIAPDWLSQAQYRSSEDE